MANQKNKTLPLVVIFGRTNVGKSTLFNRLVEKNQALVSNREGTTRDSNINIVSWRGRKFILVDTGGIMDLKHLTGRAEKTDDIEAKVQKQARRYLDLADLILFVVDNKTGLTPADRQMSLVLKKQIDQKKIILVANKVDSPKEQAKTAYFYQLALGQLAAVSAASGSGTGDLLDIIISKLKSRNSQRTSRNSQLATHISQLATHNLKVNDEKELRAASYGLRAINRELQVCIIGKPNVGKSSLLNSLLGYERVIVSPVPHTTREPQDTVLSYLDCNIKLIDTAGISRKSRQAAGLEKFGIVKSLAALDRADMALLIIDISEGITHQEAKLVEEIFNRKKSLIIIANKWDKIAARDTKKYTNYILGKLPFAKFAPIQFISALSGEKVQKIMDLVLAIKRGRNLVISQPELNDFLARVVKRHPPTKGKGFKHPKIYAITQTAANPPRFAIRLAMKVDLHISYLRFLENRLREKFGFLGTPITIKIIKGLVRKQNSKNS